MIIYYTRLNQNIITCVQKPNLRTLRAKLAAWDASCGLLVLLHNRDKYAHISGSRLFKMLASAKASSLLSYSCSYI